MGFTGGLLVDYPNSSKAKKLYLCLFTGGATVHMPLPLGLDSTQQVILLAGSLIINISTPLYLYLQASYTEKKVGVSRPAGRKKLYKSKDWILAKKERRRRQGGKFVREDTKYTGRRRKTKF